MEGVVKCALYALSEMQKLADSWGRLSLRVSKLKYGGVFRRLALKRKCQGLVFHDRILNNEPFERYMDTAER